MEYRDVRDGSVNSGNGARESWAGWLGINRATPAVLVVIGGLGFAEEIWRNFLAFGFVVLACLWFSVKCTPEGV